MGVDDRELIALERRFGAVPEAVARDAAHRMTALVKIGVANTQRATPRDTGRAQSSVSGRVSATPGRVIGEWGSNLAYFSVIERGRRPGAAMPPKGVILGWMARRSIPASAEYAIRRAIGRRGIPARRPLAQSAERVRRLAGPAFRGLGGAVSVALRGRP